MTIEQLTEKIARFNEFLEKRMPQDEEAIIERIDLLQVCLAQSGNLLAEAKGIQDACTALAIKGVVSDPEMVGMSLSLMNQYVKARNKDINLVVNQLDRINSTAGKQIMALQTILSYRKEQMRI